jgi:hypothetical protein
MLARSIFSNSFTWQRRIGFALTIVLSLAVHAQIVEIVNVIRISGNTAVISEGTGGGLKKGDRVQISRLINGGWLDIATGAITEISYNQSTIQIADGSPLVKPGDKVERIAPLPEERKTTMRSAPVPQRQVQAPTPTRRTVNQPARRAAASQPRQNRNAVYQDGQRVYLGPQIGAFIPVGDMEDAFESAFGYGGIVGVQFRRNVDICMQFFFAAKKDEWSFWNLQMLGRRYLSPNFIFDFGYGIAYPEFIRQGFASGGGNIQLGLSGGLSLHFPVSPGVSFEVGALYEYFPSFGEDGGQFFNIQGRLLL